MVFKPIIALRHTKKNQSLFNKIKSKVIKFWTKSDYFHVELILNNNWISADDKLGLSINELHELNKEDWTYIELPKIALTDNQYLTFEYFISANLNRGYDWKGIFLSQFVHLNTHDNSKFFCSEIVAKILQLLYYREFINIIPNNCSPETIYQLTKHYATASN